MKGERDLVRGLIERLAACGDDVEVGPGDDAAVLRVGETRIVWTTDSQREGVHFRQGWLSPFDLGARAWAVSASDVAAMGGRVRWALAALGVPPAAPDDWTATVMEGMSRAAAAQGCAVVGGDVSRAERAELVVTVLGELPAERPPLRRVGALVGHACWVAGRLGWAAAGRTLIERQETAVGMRFMDAYRAPRPPFALAVELAEGRLVTAAMDVSDGLAIDLARLCEASRVGAGVEEAALADPALEQLAERIGRTARDWQLSGGDDYALLCAVAPAREDEFAALAERHGVPARRLGNFVSGDPIPVLIGAGGERPLSGGWDPFASGEPA